MPSQDFIVVPDAAPIAVALEPAQNAIHSLLLLTKFRYTQGFDNWVTNTIAALSPQEREQHELVIIGFHYAILPEQGWPSFPAFVDHLASLAPHALRDKLLAAYAKIVPECVGEPPPVDWDLVLQSSENYLNFLQERFGQNHLDVELETRAYAYLVDPPAMKAIIVSHLRKMWDEYLAPEWRRVEPMLQDAVKAFRQIDFSSMTKFETAQKITGQKLSEEKWGKMLEDAKRVIFVPSAHIGPYQGKLWAGNTCWVLFGARLPEGIQYHAPDLSRAEIVVRLNALADDTRLRILKHISAGGEQRSHDIMTHLGLSQSAASRHLQQLSATGYLNERRCEGAKCYILSPDRVKGTLDAVSTYLLED